MTTVVFRTAAGSAIGIGHLMRCLHLARAIVKRGGQCRFLLDHIPEEIKPFVREFPCHALYSTAMGDISPAHDAAMSLHYLGDADWIVLDDYRIHVEWEQLVREAYPWVKICVIDDLERDHNANVVVDPGSRGSRRFAEWRSRLPLHCTTLFGPQYAILASCYQDSWRKQVKNECFSILICLGGGGDMVVATGICDSLLKHFGQNIRITVLVGPVAKNIGTLKDRFVNNDQVTCLTGITEAFPVLKGTDFYIGAAGTMLLQLRCLNIPALTLSLAFNQENDLSNLEELGHYFHLNSWSHDDFTSMASFAETVSDNYDRVLSMGKNPRQLVNGHGANKVASAILGSGAIGRSIEGTDLERNDQVILPGGYTIRPVTDSDINLYRNSRNLPQNNQLMAQTDGISALEHYAWWFSNSRESFILEKDGRPGLVIWHNKVKFQQRDFINAGWFVCHSDADFRDVLTAMRWQLDYCATHHQDIPWLSVVRKENRFARQINRYFGFEEMEYKHPYYQFCRSMFPKVSADDFYFIVYKQDDK